MTGNNPISTFRTDGAVAILKIDKPPVNALSHAVRIALHDGVTRAAGDDSIKALVIICGGRTFFAGADITEFGKPFQPPLLKDIMAVIEASTKPVIAAMHGSALGGGFEMALACHYRVALATTKIGLPESALGLLPGAGGTQRVPRLIGVEKAVEMIVFGAPYAAPKARELGLIDAVIEGADLEAGTIAYARGLIADNAPLRRIRDLAPDLDADAARALFARFRAANPALFHNLKAPENILRAIEAAVTLPFDAGMTREAELSKELVTSPESAAQRHIFFAERAAAKLPGKIAEDAVPAITAVAVIGDGSDALADPFAKAGYSVTRDAADTADLVVISAANSDDYCTTIRAAAEAAPHSILAITGAWADFDRIAAASGRAAAVIGLNLRPEPATGPVLEIARGSATSLETIAASLAVARKLRRLPVVVAAGEGLAIARLIASGRAAHDRALQSGLTAGAIAAVLEDFGFPAGLFGTAAAAGPVTPATRQAIIEHVLYPVAATGLALLGAGALWRASDLDVALVKSGLWPVHTGGPLHWASTLGHAKILTALQRMRDSGATDIAIPDLLREHAENEAAASA